MVAGGGGGGCREGVTLPGCASRKTVGAKPLADTPFAPPSPPHSLVDQVGVNATLVSFRVRGTTIRNSGAR